MLSLNRKTDYALVALSDMADRLGQWASARDIAERGGVPAALLMNVMKTLQGAGIVHSRAGRAADIASRLTWTASPFSTSCGSWIGMTIPRTRTAASPRAAGV